MAFLNGCQEGKATPCLVEVLCPNCGNIVEVFVNMGANNTGRTRTTEKCDRCGYTIEEGTNSSTLQKA